MSPTTDPLTLWSRTDGAVSSTVQTSTLESKTCEPEATRSLDSSGGSASPTDSIHCSETRDANDEESMDPSTRSNRSGAVVTAARIPPPRPTKSSPTKPSQRPKRVDDTSHTSSDSTDDSTTVSSLSDNSDHLHNGQTSEEDRRIRQFEYFVNDFVSEQSLHGTTKRGKRTNAVHLFSFANSRLFKEIIHENYQLVWNRHDQVLRTRQGHATTASTATHDNPDPSIETARRVACHVHASNCLMRQFLNMIHHGTLQAMSRYLPHNLTDEGYISPVHFVFTHVEDHVLTQLTALVPPPSLLWNHHPTSPSILDDMAAFMPARSVLHIFVWLQVMHAEVQKQCHRLVDTPKSKSSSTSTTSNPTSIVLSESWDTLVTSVWQHYRIHMVQGALRDQIHRSTRLRCGEGTTLESSDMVPDESWCHQKDDATTSTGDTVERNNKNVDKDICENDHGELVSGHPEMILAAVDEQLEMIVKAMTDSGSGSTCLSTGGDYCREVWEICLNEVSTMVADFMWHVGTSWKVMTTMRLCSIANDARRLSHLLADRASWVDQTMANGTVTKASLGLQPIDEPSCSKSSGSKGSTGSKDKGPLSTPSADTATTAALVVVQRDLMELSWHGIHYLCQRLVHTFLVADPQSGLLASVGSPSWEADSKGRAIPRTMTIFRDFLFYVEGWLNPAIIPDVLHKMFDLTLQIYVESFFCNTLQHGMKNAAVVADHISQDYLNLVIFFNGTMFQKHATDGGAFSANTIKTRLLILQSLSRLMNPSIAPSDLKEDAIRLMEETTPIGSQLYTNNEAAILHIAGLRQTNQRTKRERKLENPIEWLQMIPVALQTLQARQPLDRHTMGSHACRSFSSSIQLPDLRNSRFISKIRVGNKELRALAATCSSSSLEAMMQLIQPPLTQRNLRDFLGRAN